MTRANSLRGLSLEPFRKQSAGVLPAFRLDSYRLRDIPVARTAWFWML